MEKGRLYHPTRSVLIDEETVKNLRIWDEGSWYQTSSGQVLTSVRILPTFTLVVLGSPFLIVYHLCPRTLTKNVH